MKMLLRPIYKKITLLIGSCFFDKQYLTSTYFTQNAVGLKWIWRCILWQKIARNNKHIPWPVSHYNTINGPADHVCFDPENINNFQGKGVYIQCEKAKVVIGSGCMIANNVGLITANHNPSNLFEHLEGKDICLGNNCWLGLNVVILPGVTLGENTIVGANAVVTKSFPQGHCVIAGNPARIIKELV